MSRSEYISSQLVSVRELTKRILNKLSTKEKSEFELKFGTYLARKPFATINYDIPRLCQYHIETLKLAVLDLSLPNEKFKAIVRVLFEFAQVQCCKQIGCMDQRRPVESTSKQQIDKPTQKKSAPTKQAKKGGEVNEVPCIIDDASQECEINTSIIPQTAASQSTLVATHQEMEIVAIQPNTEIEQRQANQCVREEDPKVEKTLGGNNGEFSIHVEHEFIMPRVTRSSKRKAVAAGPSQAVTTLLDKNGKALSINVGVAEKKHVDFHYSTKQTDIVAMVKQSFRNRSMFCPGNKDQQKFCSSCYAIMMISPLKLEEGNLTVFMNPSKFALWHNLPPAHYIRQELVKSFTGKIDPSLLSYRLFVTGDRSFKPEIVNSKLTTLKSQLDSKR